MTTARLAVLGWLTFHVATAAAAAPADYFGIHVVDDRTGRGVPLVQLRTTNNVRFYTDSNGWVAFDEPGLMNRDVWFTVTSPGYDAPTGPFGFRGVTLKPKAGAVVEVKVRRTNVAERLYRLTGQGIYRDTVLLGRKPPIAEPNLNAGVMGQDTVQTAVYQDKTFWFFGDTDRPAFPLGNFHTTGATSPPPGRLRPETGIDLTYFADRDFVRPMVDMPAKSPIWIDGLMVVEHDGTPRMLARYAAVDSAMRPTDVGLLQWDDDRRQFAPLVKFPLRTPLLPQGHPFRFENRFYFPSPFATVRVAANWASVTDPAAYEGWVDGKWQRGQTPAKSGPLHAADGSAVRVHAASINWNDYRKRWVMLLEQAGGKSNLGEMWYAEAANPEGPWGPAVKVATHAQKDDNNDFYNPMHHVEWDGDGGHTIYFEGTYVNTFSGNPFATPRYNYNQIVYRLDLSDERLKPAMTP